MKILSFGDEVEGYSIPVLNEREIRAAAGILFLGLCIAIFQVLSKDDFLAIKYYITVFLIDFIIRVLITPKFSPSLIIARLIVSNQAPEFVGAPQKKFAWIIGLMLSATMFVFLVVLNASSFITGIICVVCFVFLFFESAFGICLGCIVYRLFNRRTAQYCPGEICDAKSRHAIQKTSAGQLLIVAGLVVCIVLVALLFNKRLAIQPHSLF